MCFITLIFFEPFQGQDHRSCPFLISVHHQSSRCVFASDPESERTWVQTGFGAFSGFDGKNSEPRTTTANYLSTNPTNTYNHHCTPPHTPPVYHLFANAALRVPEWDAKFLQFGEHTSLIKILWQSFPGTWREALGLLAWSGPVDSVGSPSHLERRRTLDKSAVQNVARMIRSCRDKLREALLKGFLADDGTAVLIVVLEFSVRR